MDLLPLPPSRFPFKYQVTRTSDSQALCSTRQPAQTNRLSSGGVPGPALLTAFQKLGRHFINPFDNASITKTRKAVLPSPLQQSTDQLTSARRVWKADRMRILSLAAQRSRKWKYPFITIWLSLSAYTLDAAVNNISGRSLPDCKTH